MSGNESELEKNKRIARRLPEEIASKGAIELVDELFVDDIDAQVKPFGEAHDKDTFREMPQQMRGAFPDLEATVEDIVAEDNRVAMRLTLSGTHKGQFMNLEPTGERFDIEHSVFLRIEDGNIVEHRGQIDTFGLFRQLGVLDEPSV